MSESMTEYYNGLTKEEQFYATWLLKAAQAMQTVRQVNQLIRIAANIPASELNNIDNKGAGA